MMRNTLPNTARESLSKNLRQSLEDVLRDVSLDSCRVMGSMAQRGGGVGSLGLLQQQQPQAQQTTTCNDFGLLSSDLTQASRSLALSAAVPAPVMRPNTALGLSADELILAAAAGRRVLDEARAAAAVARQRALEEETLRCHRYNESLLAFFQKGLGGPLAATKHVQAQEYRSTAAAAAAAQIIEEKAKAESKETLEVLGSSLRKKNSPYLDISSLSDPDPNDTSIRKTRGGVTEPFPEKLHRMLEEVEKEGNADIVSFYPHGRAFGVHKPDRFVSEIMPKYFKQSRLSSFQRQLNLYGFTRISSGADAGGYYHELFLKGRAALSLHMRRVGVPQGEDRRKLRTQNKRSEPNFYAMGSVAAPEAAP